MATLEGFLLHTTRQTVSSTLYMRKAALQVLVATARLPHGNSVRLSSYMLKSSRCVKASGSSRRAHPGSARDLIPVQTQKTVGNDPMPSLAASLKLVIVLILIAQT